MGPCVYLALRPQSYCLVPVIVHLALGRAMQAFMYFYREEPCGMDGWANVGLMCGSFELIKLL